jgi:hypothetical protein
VAVGASTVAAPAPSLALTGMGRKRGWRMED